MAGTTLVDVSFREWKYHSIFFAHYARKVDNIGWGMHILNICSWFDESERILPRLGHSYDGYEMWQIGFETDENLCSTRSIVLATMMIGILFSPKNRRWKWEALLQTHVLVFSRQISIGKKYNPFSTCTKKCSFSMCTGAPGKRSANTTLRLIR